MSVTKPIVKIKHKNADLNVIEIIGKPGDKLPNHKISIPAVLCIREGGVNYAEGTNEIQLSKDDFKLIPKDIVHNLTFTEAARLDLITFTSAKMEFTIPLAAEDDAIDFG